MEFSSNAFAPQLRLEECSKTSVFQAESILIFSLNGLAVRMCSLNKNKASSLFLAVLFCLRCTTPNGVTDSSLIPSPAWFGRLNQPRFVVVFPTIGCCSFSWSPQTALFWICPSFSPYFLHMDIQGKVFPQPWEVESTLPHGNGSPDMG